MITIQDIRQWKGATVVDPLGDKVGTLEAIYVDSATEQPIFAAVKVGLVGFHKLAFVPLEGAAVGKDDLRVAFGKDRVKDAPTVPTDAELPVEDEPKVFTHYGMPYTPAATPSGRRLARH